MNTPTIGGQAREQENPLDASPTRYPSEIPSVVDLVTPTDSHLSETPPGRGTFGLLSGKRPLVEDLTVESSVDAKKMKMDSNFGYLTPEGSGGSESIEVEDLVEEGALMGDEGNALLDSPVEIIKEKTVVAQRADAPARSTQLPASFLGKYRRAAAATTGLHGDLDSRLRASQPAGKRVVRPTSFVSAMHGEMAQLPDIQPRAEPVIREAKFLDVPQDGGDRILPVSLGGGSQNARANGAGVKLKDEDVVSKAAMEALLESLEQSTEEKDVGERMLNTTLMKHQRMSLHWMCTREANPKVPGGILADDQGLGKTISTLALIVTNAPPSDWKDLGGRRAKIEGTGGGSSRANCKPVLKGGTLIVCPMAVIKQWESEANTKIHRDVMFSVQMHHGSSRAKTAEGLHDYSIVLTTYGTLLSEYPEDTRKMKKKDGNSSANPIELSGDEEEEDEDDATGKNGAKKKSKKKQGPLFDVHWYRVVLDEAQTIKNSNTRGSRAAAHLVAEKRWCLSGTPVQNSTKDLFSYFRFLKFEPYCQLREFNNMRARVAKDSEKGVKVLRSLLKGILLRRTKHTMIEGEPIVNLPNRTQELVEEDMSKSERAYYDDVKRLVMEEVQSKIQTGNASMFSMLLLLLKLRQAVCHSWLVEKKKHYQGTATKRQCEYVAKLPEQRRKDMKEAINNIHDSCAICCDLPDQPMVTPCCHVFCFQCIAAQFGNATGGDMDCCPQCGFPMKLNEVMPPAAFEEGTNSERRRRWCDSMKTEFEPSTKIKRLMEILEGVRAKNQEEQNKGKASTKRSASDRILAGVFRKLPNPLSGGQAIVASCDKVLVFSQWTSMLDLIEIPLTKAKFKYRRLDGSMSLARREEAIKEFKENPDVIVLLMSLKAAALGLNLTCANHVVLFDMWWNPTIEEQAIDRAHRIGQTRDVKVTRLAIKDSVEQKILELQEEKRKMIANTLGSSGGSADNVAGQLTMEDVHFLFG